MPLDLLQHIDTTLFDLINQQWRCYLFDTLMPALSLSILLWGVIIGIVLFFYWRKERNIRRVGMGILAVLLAVGIADFSSNIAKHSVARPRPYNERANTFYYSDEWDRNSAQFTPNGSKNYSFFSGHAANSMASAAVVAALFPPAGPAAYALALGVGYSRVYMGKHYPLDVAAGWAAGFVIGKLVALLCRRTRKHLRL